MKTRVLPLVVSWTVLLAQTPSFRVSTRLIQVSVIITDHHGKPVTGLKKEQFSVFDQGRQQEIIFFNEQVPHAPSLPTSALLPKGSVMFSNRPEEPSGGSGGSVTAILFDCLNTRVLDSGFARERLAKFLAKVRPDDRIALFGLSDGLVMLHDFTSDSEALLGALDHYHPAQSIDATATIFKESNSGNPAIDAAENDNNQRFSDVRMSGRVQETADALETIANRLTGIPGRKNLVWISGSFPASIGYFQKRLMGTRPGKQGYDAETEAAARALSNANVAIYPIDARALATLAGVYDASTAPKPSAGRLPAMNPKPEVMVTEEMRTMNALADATGGKAYIDGNDLDGAVRRAIDDSAFSYTIGFYPNHEQWNGEFRRIKLKVARAGVELRYRTGYLAVADAAPQPTPMTVSELIRRPSESSGLGLDIKTENIGGRQFNLHVRVDASAMRFEQRDGRWEGQLEVLVVQIGPDGRDVSGHGQTLTFRLSKETYDGLPRNGLRIVSKETIHDNTVQLRFAARDPATGASGSLYIPVRDVVAGSNRR